MKKRMVKSADQVNAEKVMKDSEVAVRIDVPETRTSSVKLEDVLSFKVSGANVLATLRSDVGSFKRGHPFAKLIRRERKGADGVLDVSYVAVPFAFERPKVDEITGAVLENPFNPSYPMGSRYKVRRFLAGVYAGLLRLQGLPVVHIDAAEIAPAAVAEEK